MASVLDTLVADIKSAASAVENKVENFVAWAETEAQTVAAEVIADVKTFFASVAPATVTNFGAAFEGVVSDLGVVAIDYVTGKDSSAQISDILNKAEQLGITELKTLSQPTLNLLLALKTQAVELASAAEAEVKSLI